MTSNFYKDILDPGIENNSDVSEIGPDDLKNIVEGVDDIDDALFGFKPKQQDFHTGQTKSLERPKSDIKKQPNVSDLPDEDPLADISLSDDDFYDLGTKSPSAPIKRRDNVSTAPKTPSEDRLTKTKKIANLFGLDDENEVVENKKKQESAADWLGIKDSPVKTLAGANRDENLAFQSPNLRLTENSNVQDSLKNNLSNLNLTPSVSSSREIGGLSGSEKMLQVDIKSTEKAKTQNAKSENLFDLLGDGNDQPKSMENTKDKKSAIFDELFGDSVLNQKNKSRRNSAVKNLEENVEASGTGDIHATSVQDDSATTLGQYIPTVATSKRPGTGRRRGTTSAVTTAQSSVSKTLFQDDWLKSPDELPEPKQEQKKPPMADMKKSGIEMHESLPSWLGGSGITSDIKLELQQTNKSMEEKEVSKKPTLIDEAHTTIRTDKVKKQPDEEPEVEVIDTARKALVTSTEHTHQTALALQRTEAQLLAALQLQTTQSGLSAVCARQHSLLDNQEKQLTHLVEQQTDRQTQLEKQLTAQQLRIQQLMEVLAENVAGRQACVVPQQEPSWNSMNDKSQKKDEILKDFEREIQKVTFENEELRLRMELMEKHYKIEYESFQAQHRREIESWEERLAAQKELSDQLCEDYKERIKRLKESHAELLVQHNERMQQLREEKAEDMRQLMDFHKSTLEQMMVISKLVTPSIREEKKTSFQTWKPLDEPQLSVREEELFKKENTLKALQEKLEAQKKDLEKKADDIEEKTEQDKIKYDEMLRQMKHEKNQLKFQQQQLLQEKKHIEDHNYEQRKLLEEMQEKVISEKTELASEKLKLAEEKAKLDALAKLQGVSGSSSFDVLKSKAEVHGALEAARNAELQAIEERKRLREKERQLDTERWRLQEMEEDLVARAQHVDRLMQVSEANHQAGQKALDEAKQLEKRAEEKLQEVERQKHELTEKERKLIKLKLDITQEEVRVNRRRQQLEHLLPPLSSDEALTLQPMKDVIDPKLLIMRLRAEREFEASSKLQQPDKKSFNT